jgi:hypothetical protein
MPTPPPENPRYKDLNDMQLIDAIVEEVERGHVSMGRCDAGWVAWYRLDVRRKLLDKAEDIIKEARPGETILLEQIAKALRPGEQP